MNGQHFSRSITSGPSLQPNNDVNMIFKEPSCFIIICHSFFMFNIRISDININIITIIGFDTRLTTTSVSHLLLLCFFKNYKQLYFKIKLKQSN